MTFYKVWYLHNPRGPHFLVSAEDTTEARQIVADYLNETANFHSGTLFDVGYATEEETNWRTIQRRKSNGWGSYFLDSSSAWEEWKACKLLGIHKMILEYTP